MAHLEKDVELLETAIEDIEEEIEEIVDYIDLSDGEESDSTKAGGKILKAKGQLTELLELIKSMRRDSQRSGADSGKKSRISMLEDIERLKDEVETLHEEKELVEEKMYEQGIKIRRLMEENKDLKTSSPVKMPPPKFPEELLDSSSENEDPVKGTTDDESSESEDDRRGLVAAKFSPSQRINNIIKRDSATLEELFSKEDLHEELAARYGSRDNQLISFFSRPSIVNALIDTVTNIPATPSPPDNLRKSGEEDNQIPPVPYTASEILTSGIQPLTDMLCQAAYLKRFFSLLDRPPPLPGSSPIAALWYKVMSHLLQVKSMELSLYIKENSILPKVVNHINSECVLNLLLTMLNTEAKLETYGDEFQWSHLHLIELLGAKLDACAVTEATIAEWPNVPHHTTALDNISEFLCEILTKYPFSSPLVLQMQEIPFVKRLVRNCFEVFDNEIENGNENEAIQLYSSRLRGPVHCLQILVHILTLSVNGGSYTEVDMPPVITELLNEGSPVEGIPCPLHTISAILRAFSMDVAAASTRGSAGRVLLGEFRMRVLMVAIGLARTGYFWVDHALLGGPDGVTGSVLQSIFYLFFSFPWNNVVHSAVAELIISFLPPQSPTSRSKFCLVILKDLKFLENVMKISNEERRTGVLGHVANLVLAIQRAASSSQPLTDFLSTFDEWPSFLQKMTSLTEVTWQSA